MTPDDMGLVERLREEADYLESKNHPPLSTRASLREAAAAIERLLAERDEARRVGKQNADLWHEACKMVEEQSVDRRSWWIWAGGWRVLWPF